MTPRQRTLAFILITVAAWITYDAYSYLTCGNPCTISATSWYYSHWIPGIAFAAGFLAGHLFAQMHEPTAYSDDPGQGMKP